MTDSPKKQWEAPKLRTEEVQETLVRASCNYKPPGTGYTPPGRGGQRPPGPAFS